MELKTIQSRIYENRGQRVMLDFDLAELYETETKRLKEAVRRNMERFPSDFIFELTKAEYLSLRTQNASLNIGRGKHSKYPPFAFTEQGVAMLSGILKSPTAIHVNIAIMRTFVFIRQFALSHKDLTIKLNELEAKYDQQFKDVYDAINFLLTKENQESKNKASALDIKGINLRNRWCFIPAENKSPKFLGSARRIKDTNVFICNYLYFLTFTNWPGNIPVVAAFLTFKNVLAACRFG